MRQYGFDPGKTGPGKRHLKDLRKAAFVAAFFVRANGSTIRRTHRRRGRTRR